MKLCIPSVHVYFFKLQLTDAETEEEMKKHIEYVPDRPFNDLRYPMDTSKLQGLGWQPEVTWEEGLNTTSELAIYPNIKACQSFRFSGYTN